MRQRVRNPKRGEERRIRVNGTKRRKRKEKRKKGRREKGRRDGGLPKLGGSLYNGCVCLVAPSSLSNTPSNIPSAITYSLLYTLPFLHMSPFSITHTSPRIFAMYGRAWKQHTLTLFSFHSDSFVSVKSILQIYQPIRDSRLSVYSIRLDD